MRKDTSFTNGIPELLILKLLSGREMYGYQITKAIRTATENALAFGEGCVYPLLCSLKKEGFLSARRQEVDGRTRLYYSLTAKGRERLQEKTSEWRRIALGVRLVIDARS